MTLEEHIKRYDDRAKSIRNAIVEKEESQEVVELLRELQNLRKLKDSLWELEVYRDCADWLAKAVLDEDWDSDHDFYTEVICRKLTKLKKLRVESDKYVLEVKADE